MCLQFRLLLIHIVWMDDSFPLLFVMTVTGCYQVPATATASVLVVYVLQFYFHSADSFWGQLDWSGWAVCILGLGLGLGTRFMVHYGICFCRNIVANTITFNRDIILTQNYTCCRCGRRQTVSATWLAGRTHVHMEITVALPCLR